MACEEDKKRIVEVETQETSRKGHWDRNGKKKVQIQMKDETGDALALLIVMFNLSTLSLHN